MGKVQLHQTADIERVGRNPSVSQLVMGQPDKLQLGIHSEGSSQGSCYVVKLQVELMQHLREVIWNLLQFVFPHIQ